MTNKSLNLLGINQSSPIVGTAKTVGGATQNLTPNGMLPASSLLGSIGASQVGFTEDNVPDGLTRFCVVNGAGLKGVAFVDANKRALIDFAAGGHLNEILDSIADGILFQRFKRVAFGQLALPTGLIGIGTASTATANAPGVLPTDSVEWALSGGPASGYASLTIVPYVTANAVNFNVANPSVVAGVTPGAQMVNYVVIR
jgi:hypothetical protein